MTDTLLFDIDGTLVDTNYHHAVAWYRAFRRFDVIVPVWRIHRAIGMGGDRLIAAVAGDEVENRHGDDLRAAWKEEFAPLLDEVAPFEGARELLRAAKDRGQVVLASSGAKEHIEHYVDLLGFTAPGDRWITGDDAESTKPAPDLLTAALEGLENSRAVLIGDSTWDCKAAANIGLPCVTVRCGGSGADELKAAGAAQVYDALPDVQADLPHLPLATPTINPTD